MKVKDEVNGQARLDAVHAMLEEVPADPRRTGHRTERQRRHLQVLDRRLQRGDEQVLARRSADGKRSDYGTFLNKTLRPLAGRALHSRLPPHRRRADNGETFSAIAEAAKWGRRGVPLTTFTVGRTNIGRRARTSSSPASSATRRRRPIKTEVTVIGTVHAYGFAGTRVVARVYFDGKVRAHRGGHARQDEGQQGADHREGAAGRRARSRSSSRSARRRTARSSRSRASRSGENNYSETYLTVTKDGVRILVIDRLRTELTRLRDALRSEKRFDLNEVNIQPDAPITAIQREFLDLDVAGLRRHHHRQRQRQRTASASTRGSSRRSRDRGEEEGHGADVPRRRTRLQRHARRTCSRSRSTPGQIVENVDKETQTADRALTRRSRPTNGLAKMMKLAKEQKDSVALWNELNAFRSRAKITGYNRMTPQGHRHGVRVGDACDSTP